MVGKNGGQILANQTIHLISYAGNKIVRYAMMRWSRIIFTDSQHTDIPGLSYLSISLII
jgi:sugar phosphate permease